MPVWTVIPFVVLLLSIALLPLLVPHWWESNINRALVAGVCGIPIAIYVALQPSGVTHVVHALTEYVSFIVIMAALFTISGGLVLRGDLPATPLTNTIFLGAGSVLANFIGTTGASMVLIRPVLRTNSQRKVTKHIPLFFIFIVSNMAGLLTPLGDPPLFIGYLRGVPFFWTLRLLPIWLLSNVITLIVFYIWDHYAYRKESASALSFDSTQQQPLQLVGKLNIPLLAGVICCAFLRSPWRDIGMIACTLLSVRITPAALRTENRFTFHPVIEVAVLFLGIFLAMIPALNILETRGSELGIQTPCQFFWATGILSSLLDNAPTYLSFLSTAQGLNLPNDVVGVSHQVLMAISAGAVLMGANSYIGNGPNFMVKAIATEMGIPMPSFFGYMARAALVLLPIYLAITLIFWC